MAKKKNSTKPVIIIVGALIIAAAVFGYQQQTGKLSENNAAAEATKVEAGVLTPKPADIIIGDINAIVTIVEYSSLSCPHCAHFHEKVLPTIQKEFIDPGKVKLVIRHFPLNEPALKGAQLVECARVNGLERETFIKVLFDMQSQWAFGEDFMKNLKQIAGVGGMDSAAFDSCMADKEIENRILAMRQEGATSLHVSATPAMFINGMKYEGEPTVEGFREKLEEAGGGK